MSRILKCESTNHDHCWGIVWQCAECGKSVCCEEGSTEDIDLCDDCWWEKHKDEIHDNL